VQSFSPFLYSKDMIKGWLRVAGCGLQVVGYGLWERLSSRDLKNDKATAHSIFSERGSGFQPL
jgi:hypothetical protein